jgi:adenylate kinase family enzyme
MSFPTLESLGPRIMICGPSNSGKSTLGQAIGRKLGVPAIHLDLLYHVPNTDWVPRPREEFLALHADAIAGDAWVMDGNYFATVPQRLARASGLIMLGSEPVRSAIRNLRRTLFESGRRAGQLQGNIDRLNWKLFRFILFEQPPKRQRDLGILKASGLPMLQLESMRQLNALYAAWSLRR